MLPTTNLKKQLSEHMFITGMTGPKRSQDFHSQGPRPSGCGKTTTAMVGSDFIGDDLAQIWIAKDGTIRGINPEKGIFGIVEDVNREGDPYLMDCLRGDGTEVIWSNVLIDDNGVPHWVGNGEEAPKKGVNFKGEWFERKNRCWTARLFQCRTKIPRCTLLASAIENHATEAAEDPAGVPIKVFTYSGRDADTMPPVWVAKTADEGVVIGASIVSQATAHRNWSDWCSPSALGKMPRLSLELSLITWRLSSLFSTLLNSQRMPNPYWLV